MPLAASVHGLGTPRRHAIRNPAALRACVMLTYRLIGEPSTGRPASLPSAAARRTISTSADRWKSKPRGGAERSRSCRRVVTHADSPCDQRRVEEDETRERGRHLHRARGTERIVDPENGEDRKVRHHPQRNYEGEEPL